MKDCLHTKWLRWGMAAAAVVLLSANCFDRAMTVWLRDSRGEGAARLQHIRRRLFGG